MAQSPNQNARAAHLLAQFETEIRDALDRMDLESVESIG
jgi:hypothetical protein